MKKSNNISKKLTSFRPIWTEKAIFSGEISSPNKNKERKKTRNYQRKNYNKVTYY